MESFITRQRFLYSSCDEADGGRLAFNADVVQNGEDVLISGFGKFSVKKRRQCMGRNPQTGKRVTLLPRKVVTFKGSNLLRAAINGEVD
jgi:nucleoid DNA-binding protein